MYCFSPEINKCVHFVAFSVQEIISFYFYYFLYPEVMDIHVFWCVVNVTSDRKPASLRAIKSIVFLINAQNQFFRCDVEL